MKKLIINENHIRECVHFNKIEVLHIYGKINVSDIVKN